MKYEHLGTEERHSIAAQRGTYIKVAAIAVTLGRHRSTIYRELRRNASVHDGNYRATHACQKAGGRQKRSKRNMRFNEVDFLEVTKLIRVDHSPEQAVGRLRLEGRPVMSHETIYKWIWKDKKSGGNLWLHLRGSRWTGSVVSDRIKGFL